MQQHQFRIELETEGVAERRLDRETAEIVRRAAQAPEHDGA
jgi:hypothetical protein